MDEASDGRRGAARFELPARFDAAAWRAFVERALVDDLLHAGGGEPEPAPPPQGFSTARCALYVAP